MQIKGKSVVITGGTAGIGRATAHALQAAGMNILVIGRNKTRLDELRYAGFEVLAADLSSQEERKNALEQIKQRKLDILINNAGSMTSIALKGANAQVLFSREMALNLEAPVHFCLELLPSLMERPEAAIVNVTTGLVYAPMFDSPGYAAAKSGVHAITQSLRWQTAGTSVRVMEVLPPLVDTGLVEHIEGSKARPESVAKAILRGLQQGETELRVGQTKALYFMSRVAPSLASGMINKGRSIPTNGG